MQVVDQARGSPERDLQPERPDLFVSYAREDAEFARRLAAALAAHGKDVWVDLDDIPPTAEWMDEIQRGIESAGAFAFVISPSSLGSTVCAQELAWAESQGKRLIPLLREEESGADIPTALAARNWILFRDDAAFEDGVADVVRALDTDLDWVRVHTRLLVRAREWRAAAGDPSMLLRGAELREAEASLAGGAGKEPAPTSAQTEYVLASRRAATRRQRALLGSAIGGLAVALVLAGAALYQWRASVANERTARSRELAVAAETQVEVEPERSLLLALAAEDARGTPEAHAVLRRALIVSRIRRTFRGPLLGPTPNNGRPVAWTESGAGIRALARRRGVAVGRATDLNFSRDGSRFTIADDRWVRVFDATGRQLSHAPAPDVSSVLGARGRVLATVEWIGTRRAIRVYDADDGHLLRTVRGRDAAVCRNGFGAVLRGQEIQVFDLETGVARALSLGETTAGMVSFTSDCSALATEPNPMALWDPRTGRQLYGDRHESAPGAEYLLASLAPTGRLLVTATRNYATESGGSNALTAVPHDAHVSTPQGRLVATLRGHASYLTDVAFDRAGQRIVTAGEDGTARVWDARSGRELVVLRGHDGAVERAAFVDGGRVITTGVDGTSRIWDVSAGRPDAVVAGTRGGVSPTGAFAAAVGGGRVRLIDVATREVTLLGRLSGDVERVNVHDGGRVEVRLVSGKARTFGRLLAQNEREKAVARLPRVFPRADASADGRVVVTWAGEVAQLTPDTSTVVVWNGHTGSRRFTLQDTGIVLAAAVSRDGTRIATGDFGGTVVLWDAGNGRRLEQLTRHADRVLDVSFSRDGTLVASASRDTTARLTPVAGGAATVLRGHGDAVLTISLSDDGAIALSTGGDRTARLWDTATGRLLATYPSAVDSVGLGTVIGLGRGAAVLGPRHTVVTVAPSSPVVRVYACDVCAPPDRLIALARTRATRTLTKEERVRYLHEPG